MYCGLNCFGSECRFCLAVGTSGGCVGCVNDELRLADCAGLYGDCLEYTDFDLRVGGPIIQ